jgi:ubiquinone/menaquinone biosynthesis C-methylase UbiE
MPHRKFNKLQDEYFTVSKRMHEAKTIQDKMTLLNELQRILKESKEVLDEIHNKQSTGQADAMDMPRKSVLR